MNYLAVGIGGIFGAVIRYCVSSLITEGYPSLFPYGTLGVNLLGSFLLSFIAYSSLYRWKLSRNTILAINTGFIGSFTTFSTFSVEILNLINQAEFVFALAYVFVSLTAGLFLSWTGIYIAAKLFGHQEPATS